MQTDLHPSISDVSEIVHAGKKDEAQFRVYEDSNPLNAMVKRTYYNMHENQTVQFVKEKVNFSLRLAN